MLKAYEIVKEINRLKDKSYPGAFDEAVSEVLTGGPKDLNNWEEILEMLESLLDKLKVAPNSVRSEVEDLLGNYCDVETESTITF